MKGILLLMIIITLMFSCSEKSNVSEDNPPSTMDSLIYVADSAYEANNYSLSLLFINEIIQLDSTKGEFFFKRGFCLAQFSQYKESNVNYLKAAELKYRESDSFFNIGLNYMLEMNHLTALSYFRKAQKLNPSSKEIQEMIKSIEEIEK